MSAGSPEQLRKPHVSKLRLQKEVVGQEAHRYVEHSEV